MIVPMLLWLAELPPDGPHPSLTEFPALWPDVIVFLILALTAMAAVIGPVVRYHAPPETFPPENRSDT